MIDGRRGRAGTKSARQNAIEEPAQGPAPAGSPAHQTTDGKASRLGGPGRLLADLGVTADQVTVVGMLLAGATGTLLALGHLWIGVALVTVGGLMDTLDGAVAKAAGSSSRRGAFLDSVSDRVADGFIFAGLAWYLAASKTPELALLPLAILGVGNIISYERAKAESFGWVAKGGLMERAERLILLGLALLLNFILIPLLFVLLGLCVFTAAQRFVKIWRQATAEIRGEPVVAWQAPASLAAWGPARVESRWIAWRKARATGKRPVAARTSRPRRRDTVPLSTRLRDALASERAGVSRQRASRAERVSPRFSQRRQEGAAAALRRRLGTGR